MPHSPQQNGRAERWQQTIVEKAEAMRHHAGLSTGFWKLAVETAVHIYNHQPFRRAHWRTPIELWNGTVPDVSYFRVFGCLAYVHVQKERRQDKLMARAKPMVFVGYEPGSKGYQFWDKDSHSIVLSRDAVFNERSFPNKSANPIPAAQQPHEPPIPVAPAPQPALPLGDDDANRPEPDADLPPHPGPPPEPVREMGLFSPKRYYLLFLISDFSIDPQDRSIDSFLCYLSLLLIHLLLFLL